MSILLCLAMTLACFAIESLAGRPAGAVTELSAVPRAVAELQPQPRLWTGPERRQGERRAYAETGRRGAA